MMDKLQRLASKARVDDSDGFTLIELLIVVVIIGILAAIAIPQFSSTKEQAYDSSAKSDLRNLMTTQEGYFAQAGQYGTASVTEGETAEIGSGDDAIQMTLSDNITMSVGTTSGGDGFTATAQHTSSSNTFCVAVNTGGTQDGQVVSGTTCGGGGDSST